MAASFNHFSVSLTLVVVLSLSLLTLISLCLLILLSSSLDRLIRHHPGVVHLSLEIQVFLLFQEGEMMFLVEPPIVDLLLTSVKVLVVNWNGPALLVLLDNVHTVDSEVVPAVHE